jgi:hypothetical protein
MKGAKFTFLPDNTKFEVYNTTEGVLHCVALNKKGEKCSPNAKTLKTFSASDFDFGVETGGIIIL